MMCDESWPVMPPPKAHKKISAEDHTALQTSNSNAPGLLPRIPEIYGAVVKKLLVPLANPVL